MKLIIDNTNSPKGATLEGVVPTADLRRRLVAPRRSTKAEVRSLDAMVDLVWIRLRRAGGGCFMFWRKFPGVLYYRTIPKIRLCTEKYPSSRYTWISRPTPTSNILHPHSQPQPAKDIAQCQGHHPQLQPLPDKQCVVFARLPSSLVPLLSLRISEICNLEIGRMRT